MDERVRHLLLALSERGALSGEVLGQQLGVSRAQIWKDIECLRDMGLEIQSVPGRGYALAEPVELLDAAHILSQLQAVDVVAAERGSVELHFAIDSTNRRGKELSLPPGEWRAILAEYQTAGRGRRGKHWVSPLASNLCLSFVAELPAESSLVELFSLCTGVAVARAMARCGIPDVQLKWPNDIWLDGRKLAGILIELQGEMNTGFQLVVGIGINVQMKSVPAEMIDQPWASLAMVSPEISRNRLAALLLSEMNTLLQSYESGDVSVYLAEWQQRDCLRGKRVSVSRHVGELTGVALGISESGALRVDTGTGVELAYAGDVSVRPQA